MKKRKDLMIFISVVVIGIIGMILFSCEYKKEPLTIIDSTVVTKNVKRPRINVLEREFDIRLIEVDGHEYLVLDKGSIFHHEGCPCKNK